jgi:hypothetical protein
MPDITLTMSSKSYQNYHLTPSLKPTCHAHPINVQYQISTNQFFDLDDPVPMFSTAITQFLRHFIN